MREMREKKKESKREEVSGKTQEERKRGAVQCPLYLERLHWAMCYRLCLSRVGGGGRGEPTASRLNAQREQWTADWAIYK